MAHGITNPKEAGYRHKAAWHKFGTVWEGELTPQEAHDRFINFKVELSEPLTATFADGSTAIIEDRVALRRADTNEVFQTVAVDYPLEQQPQILVDLAESLANENSKIIVESIASLFGGRKIFMLLHSRVFEIGTKGDATYDYLCLSNGYDGLETLKGTPTNFRVECANMLRMALGMGSAFSFKHHSRLPNRIAFAKEALKNWNVQSEAFAKNANELARQDVSVTDVQNFFIDVYKKIRGPIPKQEENFNGHSKAVAHIATMQKIFDRDEQKFGANRWILGNAGTEWVQKHSANWHSTDNAFEDNARFIDRNMFGNGEKNSATVMEMAVTA